MIPVPDAIIRDTKEKRRKFYELYSKYKQVYRFLGRPKEIRKIPCHFKCPVSLDIMMNPVYYTKSINTRSHKYIYEKRYSRGPFWDSGKLLKINNN